MWTKSLRTCESNLYIAKSSNPFLGVAASPTTAWTATPSPGRAAPRRLMARAAKQSTTSTNPAPSSPWPRPCATNRCACWPNRVTKAPTTSTRTRCGPTPRKRYRLTYWPGTSATTWARHKNSPTPPAKSPGALSTKPGEKSKNNVLNGHNAKA